MPNQTTFEGRVPVQVALALLESLRDVDTPSDPDALAESDLPLNLQRRLGLSSVVVDQIRRYERRRSGEVPAAEVASLFELIGRRPDASRIFVEAGQRIARSDLEGRKLWARMGTRLSPRALRERAALRRSRRIAHRMSPHAEIRLRHNPHGLVIRDALSARATANGVGCATLAGAIQYVFSEYRADQFRVVHDLCEGRSGDHCEWVLQTESASEAGGPAVAEPEPATGG